MKYVQDDVVDDVVAKNATLQDVVQGRRLMLWRPGTTATVAAQCCLMFGGIGLIGSVLWASGPTVDHFKYSFFGGLLPLAGLTAGLFHAVVRGWRRARVTSYRFAIAMTALSAYATLTSLLAWKVVPLAIAAVSAAFHLAAVRLIAGEGYAIASAMFRAQRGHARRLKNMARDLIGRP